jgi:hypothetical protein
MREMTGLTPRLVPSDGNYAITNLHFNRANCPQDDEVCPLSTGQTVEAVAQQCVRRASVVKGLRAHGRAIASSGATRAIRRPTRHEPVTPLGLC